jgi:hypothetical protein
MEEYFDMVSRTIKVKKKIEEAIKMLITCQSPDSKNRILCVNV